MIHCVLFRAEEKTEHIGLAPLDRTHRFRIAVAVNIGEAQARIAGDLAEHIGYEAVMTVVVVQADHRVPVVGHRHAHRLFFRDVRFLLLAQADASGFSRGEIGGIAFFGKQGIGLVYPRERHVQPIENLLITRRGDDVMGLRIKGRGNHKIPAGIRAVAEQQVDLAAFQKPVQVAGDHELLIRIGPEGAVQGVDLQIGLQSADIFMVALKHADCLAGETAEIIALDAFVILARQQRYLAVPAAVFRIGKVLCKAVRIIGPAGQIEIAGQEPVHHTVIVHVHKFILPPGVFGNLIEEVHDQAVPPPIRGGHGVPFRLGEGHPQHRPFRRRGKCRRQHQEQRGQQCRSPFPPMSEPRFHTRILSFRRVLTSLPQPSHPPSGESMKAGARPPSGGIYGEMFRQETRQAFRRSQSTMEASARSQSPRYGL